MRVRHVGAAVRVGLVLLLACGVTLSSLAFDRSSAGPDAEPRSVAARDKNGGGKDGKAKQRNDGQSDNNANAKAKDKDKDKGNGNGNGKGKAKGKNEKNRRGKNKSAPAALDSMRIEAANADDVEALDCPDLEKVKVGGRTYCTHGDDPRLFGSGDAAETAVADSARASGPVPPALCIDDGQSGPRVQIVYVHKNGSDRLAELLPTFRRLAAEMDTIVDQSARKTGGSLRIRFVTNAQCQVDIDSVSVPSHAMDGFASLNQELERNGYDAINRKYLMLVDANSYCGIGTFAFSDKPTTAAHNFTGYARIDAPCWDAGTMIHELSHTLGAVQYSAPHTSRGAHCIDEWDVMCYRDEPHKPKMKFLCTDGSQEFRLDCGNDDYFAAEPDPGSYLSERWNMANSIYLSDGSGEICVDAALEPDDAYWYDYWGVPMPAFAVGGSQARAFCEQSGDTDWVLFEGNRGTSYRIATSDLAADVDTQIVIYRGLSEQRWDGMDQVAVNNDRAAGDPASEITFTAPGDGSYLVGISEADSRAGLDKTYTLSIEQNVAPQSGALALSRGSAKPRQKFTATMSDVTPAATVTYWWQRGGHATKLGDATANDAGDAAATFSVPRGAEKGTYQVEAIATDNAFASASLRVGEGGNDGKAGKKHKGKGNGKGKHKHKKGKSHKQGRRHAAAGQG